MNILEFNNWVIDLRKSTPNFVKSLMIETQPGRFKLTPSGDVYNYNIKWGLAQSTFAVRILYIFNKLDKYTANIISSYIKSFQKPYGALYDDLVKKKSLKYRSINFIKHKKFYEYLLYQSNERAETRQAVAALKNCDFPKIEIYEKMPYKSKDIIKYLEKLNWYNGSAGSNINHLIFFLHLNNKVLENDKFGYYQLIEKYLQNYLQDDGLFYIKNSKISLHRKITYTMKILMGLSIINRENNWIKSNLINLLFNKLNPNQACENLNPILILSKCKDFIYDKVNAIDTLLGYAQKWREDYYYPDYGGFSFYKGMSVKSYYGANLAYGKNEPDLHGTAMFIWGILLIAKILNIDEELELREPLL